jgi:hypothetical protein
VNRRSNHDHRYVVVDYAGNPRLLTEPIGGGFDKIPVIVGQPVRVPDFVTAGELDSILDRHVSAEHEGGPPAKSAQPVLAVARCGATRLRISTTDRSGKRKRYESTNSSAPSGAGPTETSATYDHGNDFDQAGPSSEPGKAVSAPRSVTRNATCCSRGPRIVNTGPRCCSFISQRLPRVDQLVGSFAESADSGHLDGADGESAARLMTDESPHR